METVASAPATASELSLVPVIRFLFLEASFVLCFRQRTEQTHQLLNPMEQHPCHLLDICQVVVVRSVEWWLTPIFLMPVP